MANGLVSVPPVSPHFSFVGGRVSMNHAQRRSAFLVASELSSFSELQALGGRTRLRKVEVDLMLPLAPLIVQKGAGPDLFFLSEAEARQHFPTSRAPQKGARYLVLPTSFGCIINIVWTCYFLVIRGLTAARHGFVRRMGGLGHIGAASCARGKDFR